MADSARVSSIQAIKDFRVAATTFGEDARASLASAETSIHRTVSWIRDQQLPHWKSEVRKRQELVGRAKSALVRKQTTPAGERADAVEEKLALKRAQARLVEAERKLKASNHWVVTLEHDYELYLGQVQRLSGLVGSEWPTVLLKLRRFIDHLESYVSLEAPFATQSQAGSDASKEADPSGDPVATTRDVRPVDESRLLARVRRWTPGPELRAATAVVDLRGMLEGRLSFNRDLLDFVNEPPLPPGPSERIVVGPGR